MFEHVDIVFDFFQHDSRHRRQTMNMYCIGCSPCWLFFVREKAQILHTSKIQVYQQFVNDQRYPVPHV